MADKKINLAVKATGSEKAARSIGKVDKGLGSLAKSAAAAAAGFFGARMLIAGMKEAVNLAARQELAERKLTAALGFRSKALENQARALQQVSMFGDELIMEAQAMLAAFIKDEDQMKKATKATLDLAAAKGMDLVAAADLIGKSVGSSTNALSRYGIVVTGAVGDTERLDSATRNIAKLFGGQAAAQADTMQGAMTGMSMAIGDAKEQLGNILAPTVISIAKNFKSAAENVGEFFLRFTETDIETRIRELKELRIDTEHLEKALRLSKAAGITKEIDNSKTLFQSKEDIRKKEEENKKLEADQQPLLDKIALNRLAHEDISSFNLFAIQASNNERVLLEANARIMQEKIDANNAIIEQNREQIDLRNQLNNILERPTFSIFGEEEDMAGELDLAFAGMEEATETFFDFMKEQEDSFLEHKKKSAKTQKTIDDQLHKEKIQNNLQMAILQGQSAKEAGISVIKAEVAEAQAGLISSIMKALPFPLNLAVAAGAGSMIGKVTDQLLAFPTGGSFVTKGRTTLPIGNGVVVGDNASGMEQVDITPLPSPNQRSSGNIVVNINAPVVDEFVVDSIIPAIRRAEKLNL